MDALSLGWPEVDALGSIVGGIFTALATALAIALTVREVRGRRSGATSAPSADRDITRVADSLGRSRKPDMPAKVPKPSPEQALRVHARILNVHRFDSGKYAEGIDFGVINDSDAPVLDVLARVPGGQVRLRAPSIGSGETRSTGMREIDVLERVNMFGNGDPDEAEVGVSFVDKNGVRWSRIGYRRPTFQNESVSKDDLFPGIPVRWGKGSPS
jgi:hypothetical protein